MPDTDTATKPAANKSEKVNVTMSDGRAVEFNKKQKLVKTSNIAEDGTVSIRLDFVNGETRDFVIAPNMLTRFAAHGAEQKLGDAIAGETDVGDAVESVDDLITRLNNGEWNIQRAAGSFAGTSILIQALVEASGKDVAAIKEFLANKSQAEKLALRRSDKLRPIIERLESEKASKSKNAVDTDSLLGELGLGETSSASSRGKAKAEATA
jgi:hypothetical protein